MIRLTKRVEFCAAHRYMDPRWTEAENRRRFGKAVNLHGHNYVLEVTIQGTPAPETGMVMDLKALKDVITEAVLDHLDHKNLNVDLPAFAERLPTPENLTVVIWVLLAPRLSECSLAEPRTRDRRLPEGNRDKGRAGAPDGGRSGARPADARAGRLERERMTDDLELLTVGRVGVDLYGEELHAGFVESRHFQKSVGGSPTNVGVAASRLGRRAAVFTRVGQDGLGEYVRHALGHEFGVDTRFVGTHPNLQTPIVVAVMDPRLPPSPAWDAVAGEALAEAALAGQEVQASVAFGAGRLARAAGPPSRSAGIRRPA